MQLTVEGKLIYKCLFLILNMNIYNISRMYIIFEYLQRVEAVEEAFSCFLVYKPEQESERLAMYQKKLCSIMSTLNVELQELAIRQYLTLTAVLTNKYKMRQLLTLLENLVNTNILQARYLI